MQLFVITFDANIVFGFKAPTERNDIFKFETFRFDIDAFWDTILQLVTLEEVVKIDEILLTDATFIKVLFCNIELYDNRLLVDKLFTDVVFIAEEFAVMLLVASLLTFPI